MRTLVSGETQMTAMTLPSGDLFSVITTADRRTRSPSWKAMLNWPRFGDSHIDYSADTPAQRNIWAARLDEAVLHAERPVLLVASGASCFATAWWARLSPANYVSRVAGALLFTPLARTGARDPELAEKFASPRIALPFPSAIVSEEAGSGKWSEQVEALAESWGSRFLESGWEREAIEGSAWNQAQGLILRMTARVVERRMRVAEALGLAV